MRQQTRDMLFVTTVVVEGVGMFPVDMLRYDNCVPATGEDVAKIEDCVRGGGTRDRTRITLRRYSQNKGRPTSARWSSFLWSVVSVHDLAGFEVL